MDLPVVSVCIITYNHAKYIKQCLESVEKQETSFPFEVIIADNSSSDGTTEICSSFCTPERPNFKLVTTGRNDLIVINGNVTGRRNVLNAIGVTSGKFIAVLEGDDYWLASDKLQRQVEFLEQNPEYSMCCSNVELVDESSEPSPKQPEPVKEICTINDLAERNFVYTGSTLYRGDLLRKASASQYFKIVPAGDYFLHMCVADNGLIRNDSSRLTAYRLHPEGIWTKKSIVFQRINVVETIWILTLQFSNNPEVVRRLIHTAVNHLDFVFGQPESELQAALKRSDRKGFMTAVLQLKKAFSSDYKQESREKTVLQAFRGIKPDSTAGSSSGFFSIFRK